MNRPTPAKSSPSPRLMDRKVKEPMSSQPQQLPQSPSTTRPFVTSDAKTGGAALCEGVNIVTGQPYKGYLIRFNDTGRREFVIGGLSTDWFQDYIGRRLRVDPYEMATYQESLLRAIEAYKKERQ